MLRARRKLAVAVAAGALLAPGVAVGAGGTDVLPEWMRRMMDDAPPEMKRKMNTPEMQEMMVSPEMGEMHRKLLERARDEQR